MISPVNYIMNEKESKNRKKRESKTRGKQEANRRQTRGKQE